MNSLIKKEALFSRRKILARINRIMALVRIRPIVNPIIENGFSTSKLKLMLAPTVIKNRPSNRPLNGSRSEASACRYLLFDSINPTRKVPSAGDSPTRVIKYAVEIINRNVAARNISRVP